MPKLLGPEPASSARCRRRSGAVQSLLLSAAILPALARAADAAPFAYVPNRGGSNLSVIDIPTNIVVATVAVGTSPTGVAVNPVGARAYVTNNGSASVSVLDTASNAVIATVPVGSGPFSQPLGIALNAAGTFAYVANGFEDSVSVIDTATNMVVDTAAVGTNPRGVAVNPAGTFVYVVNANSNSVSVIDTAASNTVVATVPIPPSPSFAANPVGIAVHPDGTRVYVTNIDLNTVSVIATATNTIVATVLVGAAPQGVAFNPAGTRAYVANSNGGSVSVLDAVTDTLLTTVPAGATPFGIAVSSAGTRVYIANRNSNSVSVMDTATNAVIKTVPVSSQPVAYGLFIGGDLPPANGDFYALAPCRVVDTRGGTPAPPIGGPILTHGIQRTLALGGKCLIPSSARAVSVNLTAIGPLGSGELVLYPTKNAATATTAISFSTNGTRANNAVLGLNALGELQVLPSVSNPTGPDQVHLVVDVNGYFD
jgi:YVTN family beta-propeller protein